MTIVFFLIALFFFFLHYRYSQNFSKRKIFGEKMCILKETVQRDDCMLATYVCLDNNNNEISTPEMYSIHEDIPEIRKYYLAFNGSQYLLVDNKDWLSTNKSSSRLFAGIIFFIFSIVSFIIANFVPVEYMVVFISKFILFLFGFLSFVTFFIVCRKQANLKRSFSAPDIVKFEGDVVRVYTKTYRGRNGISHSIMVVYEYTLNGKQIKREYAVGDCQGREVGSKVPLLYSPSLKKVIILDELNNKNFVRILLFITGIICFVLGFIIF